MAKDLKTFFKAMIHNYVKGQSLGECVLFENFESLEDAVNAAESHKYGDTSIIKVRKYTRVKYLPTIVAFGTKFDTGRLVFKEMA